MSPQPYEIYLVKCQYGESQDIRPCIIIDPINENEIKVALISSVIDLYNFNHHFLTEKKDEI